MLQNSCKSNFQKELNMCMCNVLLIVYGNHLFRIALLQLLFEKSVSPKKKVLALVKKLKLYAAAQLCCSLVSVSGILEFSRILCHLYITFGTVIFLDCLLWIAHYLEEFLCQRCGDTQSLRSYLIRETVFCIRFYCKKNYIFKVSMRNSENNKKCTKF